jgi:putative transposase
MKAYSEDLRRKIVEAVEERGMPKAEAARTFGVGLSTVKRYAKMMQERGSLAPKKRPGKRPKIDKNAAHLLEADLKERPEATLRERRERLEQTLGVRVSEATVCRWIKRL